MKKHCGFSIIELLIALLIFSFVGIGILASFKYFEVAGVLSLKKAMCLHELRSGLDYMKHDMLIAKGLYVSGGTTPSTTPTFPASFNTVNDNALTLVVPSVNASGQFIDITDDNYNDYIHYSVNSSKQIIREVVRSIAAGSARDTGSVTLAERVASLTFSNGVTNLGSLTSSQLASMNFVVVTLTAQINTTLGGTPVTKTLIMEVVFRNF